MENDRRVRLFVPERAGRPGRRWCLVGLLFWVVLQLPAQALGQEAFFEVERLNAGLGAAPDNIDRSTPHTAMASLIDLAQARDPGVAHLLNLNDLAPAEQKARGVELANMLVTVLDRKVVLDWVGLLARPDGLDAKASSKSAVAGQPRRSILLGILNGPKRPVSIRLNRVKPAGGDPVWVISRQSVANITPLYEMYGPSKFERGLPATLRKDAFWGLAWWEVVALPVLIGFMLVAGMASHRLLSRLAERNIGTVGSAALRAARLPTVIAAVTAVVAVFRQAFVFSGAIDRFVDPAVVLGFVAATLIFLVNVLDQVLDLVTPGQGDDDLSAKGHEESRALATKLSVARRVLIIVVFFAGMGFILSSAKLFGTLGFSLLASAGIVTLVLGFAAREILGNILSSLQIAVNQSARIGDLLYFDDKLCSVERINFTFVQLRVWTGVRLIVPVREFVSQHFENWSLKEPEIVRLVELKLAHDAPVERLREVFDSVLDELDQDQLDDRDKCRALVTGHDMFGQTVTFCVACSNPNTAWSIACEVRERLIAHAQKLQREDGVTMFPECALRDE